MKKFVLVRTDARENCLTPTMFVTNEHKFTHDINEAMVVSLKKAEEYEKEYFSKNVLPYIYFNVWAVKKVNNDLKLDYLSIRSATISRIEELKQEIKRLKNLVDKENYNSRIKEVANDW